MKKDKNKQPQKNQDGILHPNPEFTPYIDALLVDTHEKAEKCACFSHKTACSGVGTSRFSIIDKSTNKPPRELFCHIEIDTLWPDSGLGGGEKCDNVFIRISQKQYYFVELKKGANFDKAIGQLIATISTFKMLLGKAKVDFQKNNIYGFIAGGASPKTTDSFQKQKLEFNKNYGKSLEKTSEYKI